MATAWLVRRRLRGGLTGLAVLGAVMAVGATAALVAIGASVRTDRAYDRFLDAAAVGDVVINPSLLTTDSDALLRSLPGARAVTSAAVFFATVDDGSPRPRAALDEGIVLVRGSTDGRHLVMDRPALRAGRLATGRREAVVTEDYADAAGVAVGDTIPVAFWNAADDLVAEPEDIIEPVGVERLEVVGVGTLADEVLPDGLFPRGQVIVSPDVADRHDCLPAVPPGDPTFEELIAVLIPDGCSTSYPYYSIDVEAGAGGVEEVLAAFESGAEELNAELPPALLDQGAIYSLIATTTQQEQARVERSIRPVASTLGVLGIGAAGIALVVVGLAVARDLRRAQDDQREWWRLGLTARQRLWVLAVPPLAAIAVGLVAALVTSWLLSGLAPMGTVRVVDPSPELELGGWVLVAAAGLALSAVVLVLIVGGRTVRRTGTAVVRAREPGRVQRLARASARPEVVEGVRAAFGANRGAGLVVGGGAVATGVLTGALVFATSLAAIVTTPAAFGWPWDAAMMGGFGYGSQDVEAMQATLEEHDDVDRWTALAFASFTVEGEKVVSMVALGPPADLQLSLVSGALPSGPAQVALGTTTAADLGVEVGDEVQLDGESLGPHRAEVSGLVVFPAVGPYQANRASPGAGLLVPGAMVPPEILAAELSFVGIDLEPGIEPDAFLAELHDDFQRWALDGTHPVELAAAIRPPEIVDAESMRAAPLLLGGFLAAAAAAGLSFSVGVSVRARRRELGTLRALGFTGRQLRNSVRVQALATAVAALIVGLPLGIVVGRLLWRAYATQLGVVTDPSIPIGWVLVTVVAGIAVAVIVAARPARAAARAHAAHGLRSE